MASSLDRRNFLETAALGGIATAASAARREHDSETLVAELYRALSDEQKQGVVFDFDDPLRLKVEANWHITPHRIGSFFDAEQQAMIREIFRKLHNPDFVDRVFRHLEDDGRGIGNYSLALFGKPGSGKFELVFAGRHCTARCDGDSVEGVAFGGPIFYGHAAAGFNEAPGHPGNVYWFQAKSANRVYEALDGKQREAALLNRGRSERGTATVELKTPEHVRGLPVSDMSPDQRELVEQTLDDLLLPFRERDRQESKRLIRAHGGVETLSMSFYKRGDMGSDGVWDVWQLESPRMVWYFRGSPHVHVWANLRA